MIRLFVSRAWHALYWLAMDSVCLAIGHKRNVGICCRRCGRVKPFTRYN